MNIHKNFEKVFKLINAFNGVTLNIEEKYNKIYINLSF